MDASGAFPLAGPTADHLFVTLHGELLRLQDELSRFHELAPDRRLGGPEVYREMIRVRQELLALLEAV